MDLEGQLPICPCEVSVRESPLKHPTKPSIGSGRLVSVSDQDGGIAPWPFEGE